MGILDIIFGNPEETQGKYNACLESLSDKIIWAASRSMERMIEELSRHNSDVESVPLGEVAAVLKQAHPHWEECREILYRSKNDEDIYTGRLMFAHMEFIFFCFHLVDRHAFCNYEGPKRAKVIDNLMSVLLKKSSAPLLHYQIGLDWLEFYFRNSIVGRQIEYGNCNSKNLMQVLGEHIGLMITGTTDVEVWMIAVEAIMSAWKAIKPIKELKKIKKLNINHLLD